MTNSKHIKAQRAAKCGKYNDTYAAIIKTLAKHTDINKLTAKQIAEIADAMHESNQIGYFSGARA